MSTAPTRRQRGGSRVIRPGGLLGRRRRSGRFWWGYAHPGRSPSPLISSTRSPPVPRTDPDQIFGPSPQVPWNGPGSRFAACWRIPVWISGQAPIASQERPFPSLTPGVGVATEPRLRVRIRAYGTQAPADGTLWPARMGPFGLPRWDPNDLRFLGMMHFWQPEKSFQISKI